MERGCTPEVSDIQSKSQKDLVSAGQADIVMLSINSASLNV
jgi:hypothetical protein